MNSELLKMQWIFLRIRPQPTFPVLSPITFLHSYHFYYTRLFNIPGTNMYVQIFILLLHAYNLLSTIHTPKFHLSSSSCLNVFVNESFVCPLSHNNGSCQNHIMLILNCITIENWHTVEFVYTNFQLYNQVFRQRYAVLSSSCFLPKQDSVRCL